MAIGRGGKNPLQVAVAWVKKQNTKVKAVLALLAVVVSFIFIRFSVKDHDNLFVASEVVHAVGILVLIYKLTKEKTCAGLSLKSQELTAIFLGVRLYCSVLMEYDIHSILDFITLAVTVWVIYTIRFKLKNTFLAAMDDLPLYYVLVPCAVLAIAVHPKTRHHFMNEILWAFCVYLEAVSVLPQLRVMQKAKVVEPFTSHYVFALGISRFLSCAHWILEVYDRSIASGTFPPYYSSFGLWPTLVLLSEAVQTLILADFCYYYVKSKLEGRMLRLPSGVV